MTIMKVLNLISYENCDKVYYRLNLESNEVSCIDLKSEPGEFYLRDGFGEYLQLQNPPNEKAFVALYGFEGSIHLQFGKDRYVVDGQSKVRRKLPLLGNKRSLTLLEGSEIKTTIEYINRGKDYFEDGDGDICWWIEGQLETSETRKEFLADLPRPIPKI